MCGTTFTASATQIATPTAMGGSGRKFLLSEASPDVVTSCDESGFSFCQPWHDHRRFGRVF